MVRAEATAKYIRTSAQKAGLVLDSIRGKNVNLALSALQFSRKSVARDVAKVLRSAVANAQQQDAFGGDVARLFVSGAFANNGPSQKRVRPAPMGRAFRIIKRTTHLTVQVTERAQVIKAVGAEGSAKPVRRQVAQRRAQSKRGKAAQPAAAGKAAVSRSAQTDKGRSVVGQKVHPYGFRIGFNKTWKSRWFATKDYANLLHEDLALKKDLKKRFQHAGVAMIEIERAARNLEINIHTSRPGIIIGRKGQEVDKLKQEIQKRTNREVFINIQEIQKPELDAQLVGESVAMQLEKRVAFRRAMRKAVESALRFGARGIKVRVSGRLNGAEIARSEWYLHGQLPLQTLRADIDYGFAEANTDLRQDRGQGVALQGRAADAADRP